MDTLLMLTCELRIERARMATRSHPDIDPSVLDVRSEARRLHVPVAAVLERRSIMSGSTDERRVPIHDSNGEIQDVPDSLVDSLANQALTWTE
jgi:hypothetical protein